MAQHMASFPRVITYEFARDIELRLVNVIVRDGKEIHPPESVILHEINAEEIATLRRSKKPGIIVKFDSKTYYYAELCDRHVIIKCGAVHKCRSCEHVTAASDEEGGCFKVRNLKKRIEEYSFILWGYQTINVNYKDLAVYVCWNYEPFNQKGKMNKADLVKMMAGLKEYYDSPD